MPIHLSRNNQQYGPYELDHVNAGLKDGSLLPTDLAWSDGMPGWVPLAQYPGVQIASRPVPTQPPPMPSQTSNIGAAAPESEEARLQSTAKTLQTLYAVFFGLAMLMIALQATVLGFSGGSQVLFVLLLCSAVGCRLKRTSIVNRLNQIAHSRGGPSSI